MRMHAQTHVRTHAFVRRCLASTRRCKSGSATRRYARARARARARVCARTHTCTQARSLSAEKDLTELAGTLSQYEEQIRQLQSKVCAHVCMPATCLRSCVRTRGDAHTHTHTRTHARSLARSHTYMGDTHTGMHTCTGCTRSLGRARAQTHSKGAGAEAAAGCRWRRRYRGRPPHRLARGFRTHLHACARLCTRAHAHTCRCWSCSAKCTTRATPLGGSPSPSR